LKEVGQAFGVHATKKPHGEKIGREKGVGKVQRTHAKTDNLVLNQETNN